jgi:hypothetical protein
LEIPTFVFRYFLMTGMTPGALGASVIHLPRRGYDVRSYVPMNESCRFEAHVGTSNFTGALSFEFNGWLPSHRGTVTLRCVDTYNSGHVSPRVLCSGMKPREVDMTPGGEQKRKAVRRPLCHCCFARGRWAGERSFRFARVF